MRKSVFKLLASALLVAAVAAPSTAFAAVVYGENVDVTYGRYTPVSHSGNSFTFSGIPFTGNGDQNTAVVKDLFSIDAHDGQALTGKLSFTMEVAYQFTAPPVTPFPYTGSYGGGLSHLSDVLVPACPKFCGPLDAQLIGVAEAGDGATANGPTSGTWYLSSNITDATGNYDTLFAYNYLIMSFNSGYGSMQVKSLTFTFDTVAAMDPVGGPVSSPVPELPPAAMLGLGLAALALRVRSMKARARS